MATCGFCLVGLFSYLSGVSTGYCMICWPDAVDVTFLCYQTIFFSK